MLCHCTDPSDAGSNREYIIPNAFSERKSVAKSITSICVRGECRFPSQRRLSACDNFTLMRHRVDDSCGAVACSSVLTVPHGRCVHRLGRAAIGNYVRAVMAADMCDSASHRQSLSYNSIQFNFRPLRAQWPFSDIHAAARRRRLGTYLSIESMQLVGN